MTVTSPTRGVGVNNNIIIVTNTFALIVIIFEKEHFTGKFTNAYHKTDLYYYPILISMLTRHLAPMKKSFENKSRIVVQSKPHES